MEQRAVIKFHAKLGKNASETFWLMQQVYGDDFLSRANFFLCHKSFLEGRKRLEDDNREERPISAMFITYFDSKGIIYKEFVPTGQTITGAYYLEVLKCLMARIRRIRPEYRDPEIWSLLHDNALSHTSLIVFQFLAQNQVCALNAIPQNELKHAFESLFNRYNKCIETRGEYFE